MLVAPFDLEKLPPGAFVPATAVGPAPNGPNEAGPNNAAPADPGLIKALQARLATSRAVTATQHLVFRQPSNYVPLYLHYGDKADFLRPPFTPAWRHRLAYADQALGYIADKVHATGTPLVMIFIPQEAQADMVATGMEVAGVDPWAMGRAMGEIARRHGIAYFDMTGTFRGRKETPELYLNVDGHLNGRGDALVAKAAQQALTGDGGPAVLRKCRI